MTEDPLSEHTAGKDAGKRWARERASPLELAELERRYTREGPTPPGLAMMLADRCYRVAAQLNMMDAADWPTLSTEWSVEKSWPWQAGFVAGALVEALGALPM